MPAIHTKRPPRRGGFTLVELLVTLGIISLLLALLLSAASRATRRARTTTCLSSLRQLGLAFYAYANDWGGAMPVVMMDNRREPKRKSWYDFISPYTGPSINPDGTQPAAWSDHLDEPNPLWGCPEFDLEHASGPGYAMNVFPLADGTRPLFFNVTADISSEAVIYLNGGGTFFRLTQWARPSEKALLEDSPCSVLIPGLSAYWPWPGIDRDSRRPLGEPSGSAEIAYARHADKGIDTINQFDLGTNTLFVDGHASTLGTRAAFDAVGLGSE